MAEMSLRRSDLKELADAHAAELERQEAFGLSAARRAYDAASVAEVDATAALLDYRCATMEEIRQRAAYLLTVPHVTANLPSHGDFLDLLRSMAPEAAEMA